MEAKTTREMQAALAKPFAPEDLEWRLQNTNEEKMRGMAVPYVTNHSEPSRRGLRSGKLVQRVQAVALQREKGFAALRHRHPL